MIFSDFFAFVFRCLFGGFTTPRNLLFSVFIAEIKCFLRFHEVRRGMLFGIHFRLFFEHFGNIFVFQNSYFLEFFSSTAAGCILRTFWGYFGSILVILWRTSGSLWAPFGCCWFHLSSLLHLGGTLFAPCAPCWWPLGSFSFPSGILAAFWMDFVAFSKEFNHIFPFLAVTGGIPSFFTNVHRTMLWATHSN